MVAISDIINILLGDKCVQIVALLEAVGALADGEIHGVIGPNSIRNSHLFAPVITNRFQVPSVSRGFYNIIPGIFCRERERESIVESCSGCFVRLPDIDYSTKLLLCIYLLLLEIHDYS